MANYNKWKDYCDNLLATDKRFNGHVVFCFEDGSHMTFLNSFYIEEKDELIVLTEHCGVYIVPKTSLNFRYYLTDTEEVKLVTVKKPKDD